LGGFKSLWKNKELLSLIFSSLLKRIKKILPLGIDFTYVSVALVSYCEDMQHHVHTAEPNS
jgi:hypothetical protein